MSVLNRTTQRNAGRQDCCWDSAVCVVRALHTSSTCLAVKVCAVARLCMHCARALRVFGMVCVCVRLNGVLRRRRKEEAAEGAEEGAARDGRRAWRRVHCGPGETAYSVGCRVCRMILPSRPSSARSRRSCRSCRRRPWAAVLLVRACARACARLARVCAHGGGGGGGAVSGGIKKSK
jgi:hypothetical protein